MREPCLGYSNSTNCMNTESRNLNTMYVYIYLYIYISVHMHMCVCMYICIYIYIAQSFSGLWRPAKLEVEVHDGIPPGIRVGAHIWAFE